MDERTRDTLLGKIFHRPPLRDPVAPLLPVLPPPVPVPAPGDAPIKKQSLGSRFMFAAARFIFKIQGTPFWEKNLTTLFYGPRSQGKSLHQAKTVFEILKWLDALYRFYPDLPQAVVVSNQKFNPKIETKYLGSRLFYWESIQQLKYCPRPKCWKTEYTDGPVRKKRGVPQPPKREAVPHRLHDCYLVMDDAATIIPADGWQDLPRWFRKVFAQAGHNGVHVVANIQDPLSCDINFRRYVDLCFKFSKIIGNKRPEAGKPPVNIVWGIYASREVPAEELWIHGDKSESEIQQEKIDREEEEAMARAAGKKIVRVGVRVWRRRFHFIRRKYTEIYDTLQNVPEYMPNSLEHIELNCTNPDCKLHKKGFGTVRHRVI